MATLKMDIGGMTCGHCVGHVKKALATLEGVEVREVQVGTAVIDYDPAAVSTERIAAALDDQGYTLTGTR